MADLSSTEDVLVRPTGFVPIGFHVTLRLSDDRPIAMSAADLRTIARVVLEQSARRGLLAFGTADNHIHVVLATLRASAGRIARSVENALRRRLGLPVPFERARIKPLHDQKHAYNAFKYVHHQDSHHGLGRDPTREGTTLPDLLGWRVFADSSLVARVRAHLPRVSREMLVGQFPRGTFDDRPINLDILADAAAAALAVPDLLRTCVDVTRARRAAVHVAGPDVSARLLGESLGIGARAVQILRTLAPEPLVVQAVKLQALLRTSLAPREDAVSR